LILYFLGPKGTYSEACANKIKNCLNEEITLKPISTIPKIINLLNENTHAIGVVPIENSIEGIVRSTIDNLYASNVKIQAQTDVQIEHCLISKNKKENIKHIASHPQALAQCQNYIVQNFDEDIDLINVSSTAIAKEYIEKKDETYAAIVSKNFAKTTNLNIIDYDIQDVKDNKTRFVLISKKNLNLANPKRTSIVFNTKNKPGALLEILNIIHKHNLNLVYLESRPSKTKFGEYNFFADIDKGIIEITEALSEIKEKCESYKLLGSYSQI